MNEMLDEPAYNRVNYGLIFAAVFSLGLILVSMGKTDEGSVKAFRLGYIVAFIMLLFKAMISCSRIKIDPNDNSKFSKIIQIVFPFVPILSIIFMIMMILFRHYDKITQGQVSDYYTSFINLASVLIILQISLIFKEITATNLYLPKKMASIIRLLGLLSLLSVITVHIVLKYYVTDC
jgi:hypothetical protein